MTNLALFKVHAENNQCGRAQFRISSSDVKKNTTSEEKNINIGVHSILW